MTGPSEAFERSLRDGPPDEDGYRAQPLGRPAGATGDGQLRIARIQPVVSQRSARRPRIASTWSVMAAVILVVICLGAVGFLSLRNRADVGGPAATAPARPGIVVPPMTDEFTSPRNGFSLRHPNGWTVKPATAPWLPGIFLPHGNPALDQFTDTGKARLVVSSQRLEAGQTSDDWLAAFFHPYQGANPCAGDRTTWPRLTIGGQSGYLDAAGCTSPADDRISERDVWYEALVFSGDRVYQITLDGDVDLAYFEAVLATIRLDPSTAVD